MRSLAIATLAIALAAPALAQDDGPLDAHPMTWRGAQLGAEQVYEGDFTTDYQTSVLHTGPETVWLSGWQDRPGDNGGITRRYHLRFVGRHTLQPGRYGGLGRLSPHYPDDPADLGAGAD
jgi:hypothetical protein